MLCRASLSWRTSDLVDNLEFRADAYLHNLEHRYTKLQASVPLLFLASTLYDYLHVYHRSLKTDNSSDSKLYFGQVHQSNALYIMFDSL